MECSITANGIGLGEVAEPELNQFSMSLAMAYNSRITDCRQVAVNLAGF